MLRLWNVVQAWQCIFEYVFPTLECPTDVDECMLNQDNCHSNAECFNMEGSFACTCKSGYIGSGTFCSGEPAILTT